MMVEIKWKHKWRSLIIKGGYWQLYLMLLIPVIFLIIFKYLPMAGVTIAFYDYNIFAGLDNSKFVGIKHFTEMFSDQSFLRALRNTLFINLFKLMFWVPLPLILAIMFNELKDGLYKKAVQTITYFPHFLSWVIVGGIFLKFLAVNDGIVNNLIQSLGMKPVRFMYDKNLFPSVLVASSMWKEVGFGTVIYMGVLAGIDPCLYESAMLDGASKFKQAWYITLPSLVNTMMVVLIIDLGNLLTNSFEQILVMYNESVYQVADVISTYVYRIGIGNMSYSYSTAVNLFNGVISFILVMSTNALCRRFFNKSLW